MNGFLKVFEENECGFAAQKITTVAGILNR